MRKEAAAALWSVDDIDLVADVVNENPTVHVPQVPQYEGATHVE